MTATDLLFEPVNPAAKVKRDRWGRYVIPHPETGKEQSWTRATTLAGTLADRFGLEQWAKRNVALGIGWRADLYAQAASCTPDDRDTLNQIVTQAEEASKAKAGANLGTALHRFTERLDAGEEINPPAPWDADVAAYRKAMADHGVAVVDGWLERILLVPEIDVAGTCDRLVNAMEWRLPRIGDLKTAKDVLRYSMVEIALQLAIYAHATHWFDPATGKTHELDVQIDQDLAVVMHLPVGQADCKLYEVDIAAGWEAVQLAVAVRDWRKRKDLAGQMVVLERALEDSLAAGGVITEDQAPKVPEEPDCVVPATAPNAIASDGCLACDQGEPCNQHDAQALHAQRIDWLRARVQAIVDAGHGIDLAREWSQHDEIPTMKHGGPRTPEEVEVVSEMCWAVEERHGLSFPDHDPGVEAFTKALKKAGLVDG